MLAQTGNFARAVADAKDSGILCSIVDPIDHGLRIELRTNNGSEITTDALRELLASPRLEPLRTDESLWRLGGRGPKFGDYFSIVLILKENSDVVVLWNVADNS